MKLRVDVLALSATPIPRTLQMSLAGLRDISVIETPPEGRRPVRTYVGPWDEDLVSKAIHREVERGGQAFFLHNRIDSLTEVTERLRALVPGARFLEAHGQMDERQLEETMLTFLRGDAHCLVATTIIESGLDIPTANTLIVERADQLGLAQAYQIRGRVGRSDERAFAYLLYPSPEALTEDAAARLSTLADHTELGSGFRIAMRDLDIRGAGNLLGDEQSGHVAAVGFELYCQMIDEAVAEAADDEGAETAPEPVRLDVPVDAYLPATYIPFEAAKIDVHRRIAAAREPGELRAIADELHDRFGPPPPEAENLLRLQRARIELGRAGARSVEFRGGRLSVTGVQLESSQVDVLREAVEGAIYEWREQTVAVRVPGDPDRAARRCPGRRRGPAGCHDERRRGRGYAADLVTDAKKRRKGQPAAPQARQGERPQRPPPYPRQGPADRVRRPVRAAADRLDGLRRHRPGRRPRRRRRRDRGHTRRHDRDHAGGVRPRA